MMIIITMSKVNDIYNDMIILYSETGVITWSALTNYHWIVFVL
jgi:hypothetical protein